MANYKGHIAGGALASGLYASAIIFAPLPQLHTASGLANDWQVLLVMVALGTVFGIFPDVDTNSKAQDLFFGILFPLDILLIVSGNFMLASYLGLIAMLPILGHHRGWTHKKWAVFIVPSPIIIVPYLYSGEIELIFLLFYGSAVIGYASHLLLDGKIFKKIHFSNK